MAKPEAYRKINTRIRNKYRVVLYAYKFDCLFLR